MVLACWYAYSMNTVHDGVALKLSTVSGIFEAVYSTAVFNAS